MSPLLPDNPSKEYRNGHLGRYCCSMATTRQFMTMGHEHLCVGHTHEDVGAQLSFVCFEDVLNYLS